MNISNPRPLGESPRPGYSFAMIIVEPKEKRAIAFFDGQNLFRCAQTAFGITHPNYDPIKLATAICAEQSWKLIHINCLDPVDYRPNRRMNHGR